MAADHLFSGPAIVVEQPIGRFWVASIPASVLLKATVPDTLRVALDPEYAKHLDEWRLAIKMLGNQRGLEQRRLEDIAKYVDTVDATFPNAIILSANSEIHAPHGHDGAQWKIIKRNGHSELVIPAKPHPASVVDGQHRLYSFLYSEVEKRQSFQLLCAVFFEMPHPVQAMIFATINTNQKPVRRGLALNLYGYNVEDQDRSEWSPEKLAVFMARRLNFDKESPLFGRIKIEAADAPVADKLPGATRAVYMASVVDGILELITTNHRDDRSSLKSERRVFRAKRAELKDDGAPLRRWYTMSADRQLYEVVRIFLRVAHDELWSSGHEGSMLVRAVGMRALFSVLRASIEDIKVPREPPPEKKMGEVFTRVRKELGRLLGVGKKIDFADSFFEASGRGQVRIANSFLLKNGLMKLEDMPEGDRTEYRRVLKLVG